LRAHQLHAAPPQTLAPTLDATTTHSKAFLTRHSRLEMSSDGVSHDYTSLNSREIALDGIKAHMLISQNSSYFSSLAHPDLGDKNCERRQ
jgi:hypothetical protein